MRITFGKHNGKSVELVMLKAPAYVSWLLAQNDAVGQLLVVKREIIRLIDVFNAKPILRKCSRPGCDRNVIRGSVYKDNVGRFEWWCDKCDPLLGGFLDGKVHVIRTYQDALEYINFYCWNKKSDYEVIIHALAKSKGLSKRVGEKQAWEFLGKSHEVIVEVTPTDVHVEATRIGDDYRWKECITGRSAAAVSAPLN